MPVKGSILKNMILQAHQSLSSSSKRSLIHHQVINNQAEIRNTSKVNPTLHRVTRVTISLVKLKQKLKNNVAKINAILPKVHLQTVLILENKQNKKTFRA